MSFTPLGAPSDMPATSRRPCCHDNTRKGVSFETFPQSGREWARGGTLADTHLFRPNAMPEHMAVRESECEWNLG
eukprot:1119574-Pyramimonas_sp.AAC.1